MDASWFLLLLSATVLFSLVLLAFVCLDCWNKGPLVSIRQTNASEEYMPSSEFRVIHPLQPTSDLNSIRSAPHLLSPQRIISPSADGGAHRRQRSFTPTETESIPSYENPPEGLERANPPDSDVEDPGYITVIPDGEALAPSNRSGASTPSSDVRHDYVNLEEEQDYLNVDPQLSQVFGCARGNSGSRLNISVFGARSNSGSRLNLSEATPESSAQSDSDDDDDDDDEGNYVNQPPMIHSQLRA